MIITINNLEYDIRDSEDSDYQFVYELLKENMYSFFMKHWGEWNSKPFEISFYKKKIKIIEHQAKRIGFYDLSFKKDFAYLHDFQITESMQKKGIGTYLMNYMEEETRKHNLPKIRLKVFEDNFAREFYLKIGYEEVKVEGTSAILEKVV